MTTILLSASGAPGSARLIRALRENGERGVRIVGTDMSDRAIGKHLCDVFHVVPPGSSPDYADAILHLVEREHVDVVAQKDVACLRLAVEGREAIAARGGRVQQLTVVVEVEGAVHSVSTSIRLDAASARSSASRFVSPTAIT